MKKLIIYTISFAAFSLNSADIGNKRKVEEDNISDYELPKKKKKLSERENDEIYEQLSKNKIFEECNDEFDGEFPDVGQDKIYVMKEEDLGIATSGLSACLAIFAIGKSEEGKNIVALAHSSGSEPKEVLDILNVELEKNCPKESIEFYVLGGNIDELSQERQSKFTFLSKKYNIKGLKYSTTSIFSDDDMFDEDIFINVLYQNGKIYYGQNLDFKADPNKQDCGECL